MKTKPRKDASLLPLSRLKAIHEGDVDHMRALWTKPFERRAKWLINQVAKEIPVLKELVYCNGDNWFTPEEAMIKCVDTSTGETYEEQLRHILDAWYMSDSKRVPVVTVECLSYIKELFRLSMYCGDSKTLNPITAKVTKRGAVGAHP